MDFVFGKSKRIKNFNINERFILKFFYKIKLENLIKFKHLKHRCFSKNLIYNCKKFSKNKACIFTFTMIYIKKKIFIKFSSLINKRRIQ